MNLGTEVFCIYLIILNPSIFEACFREYLIDEADLLGLLYSSLIIVTSEAVCCRRQRRRFDLRLLWL